MRDDCKKFDSCSAPLCPLDLKDDMSWFADEEICTKENLPWIKIQKKIVKVNPDSTKYFTVTMLKQNCRIRSGIQGLDPDSHVDEKKLVKQWLAKHPPKKEMSEERKEEAKKHLSDGLKKGIISRVL